MPAADFWQQLAQEDGKQHSDAVDSTENTPVPAVSSADHGYCEKPKTGAEMLEAAHSRIEELEATSVAAHSRIEELEATSVAAHSRIEELEATSVALQSKNFSWVDFQVMHRV